MSLRKLSISLWYFGLKQAWACMFGGLMLLAIIVTHFVWPDNASIPRYDFLFFWALFVQVAFLLLKLETLEEAKVIFLFHIVGTIMELFKTSVGSWVYPEENYIRLYGVPLFSGFMYSGVGSYLARVWRECEFRFKNYPDNRIIMIIGLAIYINFFTHHYLWDIRYLLFAAIIYVYRRTWIYYSVHIYRYRMPVLLAIFLGAFFIWAAENIATYCSIWVYPNQHYEWQMVPFSKFGSWFLLFIISGVLLTFIQKPEEELPEGEVHEQL